MAQGSCQGANVKGEIGGLCYNWQCSYLYRQKDLVLGVGVVFASSCNMLCTFFSNLNISNLGFRVLVPLRGPSRSLLVVRRPRSLKLSTSTCIKEMWGVVAEPQVGLEPQMGLDPHFEMSAPIGA